MQDLPHRKNFLFINKSERSTYLSRSLPLEKAAVQRHVQTGRKRSRKPNPARLTAEAHAMNEYRHNNSPHVVNHSSQLDALENQVERTANRLKAKKVESHYGSDENEIELDAHATTLPLNDHSILNKRDPFNAASVTIDRRVAGLLHYYMYYHHPSQWPNEMTLLRQGVYMFQSSVLSIMQNAITDQLAMYCLLSSAACRLQFVDRLKAPLVVGTENHYMCRAVQLMASYVATCDPDDFKQLRHCLVCIIFLSSAEAYRGDISASKMHLNAAVRLLKPKGGLAIVQDESLQGQLAMADLFLGCVQLEPCLFDCPYDPGPASSLDLSDQELLPTQDLSTASSFLNRPGTFLVSEMEVIIQDLLESYTVKNRILTSNMSPVRAMQVTHWISTRNMAIRHRLLALKTEDPRNDVLGIAIIMWTLFAMNVTGRAKTVKLMAPKLNHKLSEVPISDWMCHEDVKLWIVLVGFYCASEGSETAAYFLSEIQSLRSYRLVSSPAIVCTADLAERLEMFQRQFFFDETAQRVGTYALAEKLRANGMDSI